jgi:hypothetical protein
MARVSQKAYDRSTPGALTVVRISLAAALLAVALTFVGGAKADLDLFAPLDVNAVTVVDDVLNITGSVGDATADLEVNGAPVYVDALGNFIAMVDAEKNAVVFSLLNDLGEATTITIPVAVLVENGGDGVLNDLVDAGVTLNVPEEGFLIQDGNGPVVSGYILNDGLLESASVNGIDILNDLGPGGGFSLVLPWQATPPSSSSSHVTVVIVDHRGVSQASTFRATRVSSAIRTRAGTSVSAAGARGVRIARITFDRSSLKAAKRLHVTVTVKDRRGMLVRGAALRLTGTPSRYLAAGAVRAGFTNRIGKARFTYRLHPRAFANCGCKRLAVTVRASTSRAATKRAASLRLPALAR